MNIFKSNREKLYKLLPEDSFTISFSGTKKKKIGDEFYPFTPNRNFYYLTGIDEPDIVFICVKHDGNITERLFIKRYDEVKAKWTGETISPEKAKEISDIEDILYVDELYEELSNLIFNNRLHYAYLDLENRDFTMSDNEIMFAEKIKGNYPYLEIKNLHFELDSVRQIKEKYEIQRIKKAIEITDMGLKAVMKSLKNCEYEYEAEAEFDYVLKKNGIKDFAFKTIAASGENATVLHYSENNSKINKGDLVLFDLGAQFEYYNADITRTYPANGIFTDKQKMVYNIVLEGQQLVIDSIKPGKPFKLLNEQLKEYYAGELKKIGLIQTEEDVSKYYYHGVSHMLGLETHDVGRHNEGDLKPGYVMTVEPGLYIPEWKIGIRIEDDVYVTQNGCEVLSKDIIKTCDEIEEFMNA